jgi:hypothetical protein
MSSTRSAIGAESYIPSEPKLGLGPAGSPGGCLL